LPIKKLKERNVLKNDINFLLTAEGHFREDFKTPSSVVKSATGIRFIDKITSLIRAKKLK